MLGVPVTAAVYVGTDATTAPASMLVHAPAPASGALPASPTARRRKAPELTSPSRSPFIVSESKRSRVAVSVDAEDAVGASRGIQF